MPFQLVSPDLGSWLGGGGAPRGQALSPQTVGAALAAPLAGAKQPIPFSHRQHATVAGCELCHTTATTAERAGLPKVDQCMLCHQTVRKESPSIRRLAAYQANARLLDWIRIYQVPDYVFFSHAKHLGDKIECAACHGPVVRRDVLIRELPVNMKSCVDCHRARNASIACNLCHELGQ